jgi:sodium-dependent dicarboxylate transporter 2/3/5
VKRLRLFNFGMTLALGLGVYFFPTPEGLSPSAQGALTVFAVCFYLWITHALPLAVTSLLVLVLLPLVGAMDTGQAFALFGNRAVFFILGAFILAAAMLRSGLSSRMGLVFLRYFDRSPRRLILGVLFTSAILSFFMPEHAVAALLFPIVLEIAHTLGLERGFSNYGKALFLALAWGCVIGGVATLLGGARNPLALALLRDHVMATGGGGAGGPAGASTVTFAQWTIAVIPLVIVLWLLALLVLYVGFPFGLRDVSRARVFLDEKVKALGPLSWHERRVAIIVGATVLTWITLGDRLGLAEISIAAAVALFVFDAIQWRDVESYVNWGVILMYGGAVALGSAVAETGAAHWVTAAVLNQFSAKPFAVLGLMSLIAKVITEGMSNAAAVAILLPVGFGMADEVGLSAIAITFAVAVPAGLTFSFPMGTPPNAIAYSAGYYSLRDSVVMGLILNVASWILFLFLVRFWWPLIGWGNLISS